MKRIKTGEQVFDFSNILFMLFILVIMAYPFWYVLCYSVSDPTQLKGGMIFYPKGLVFNAFRVCLSNPDIVSGAFISVSRTVIGAGAMIFITSMAAYALSKNELFGIKYLRILFIFTMYFSGGIIPTYMVVKALGLTGTFAVYVIPGLASVFNMILIRTYIESLPKSLEESALISGANEIIIFFRIIFPLCKPVIAAVALFASVGQWNAYIDTQLYNYKNSELYSLQYILFNYLAAYTPNREQAKQQVQMAAVPPQSIKMAITVITIVPIAFAYPFLQKYFVSGILIGSVKA